MAKFYTYPGIVLKLIYGYQQMFDFYLFYTNRVWGQIKIFQAKRGHEWESSRCLGIRLPCIGTGIGYSYSKMISKLKKKMCWG